ncbi:MAG: ABC transporter permease [Acidobacteria bacterium]|nr:ABC transporter permease [Acidobacteriota bacterium]
MKSARGLALILLCGLFLTALLADVFAPSRYDEQFRDDLNVRPSRKFPLGTDDLGRDRLSRLLYGARVSLSLAPAAALVATLLAGAIGLAAGMQGGLFERAVVLCSDLFQSLPWFFLLLTVRALLPLNVPPLASLAVTFAVLSLLGWAGPVRVVRAGVRTIRESDYALQARALGCSRWRLFFVHLAPNLRPVLLAQFWISVPVFILAEANLSLLGLGVAEPLPSLGSLLRELENYSSLPERPWILAPACLLTAVMVCFHLLVPREDRIG